MKHTNFFEFSNPIATHNKLLNMQKKIKNFTNSKKSKENTVYTVFSFVNTIAIIYFSAFHASIKYLIIFFFCFLGNFMPIKASIN